MAFSIARRINKLWVEHKREETKEDLLPKGYKKRKCFPGPPKPSKAYPVLTDTGISAMDSPKPDKKFRFTEYSQGRDYSLSTYEHKERNRSSQEKSNHSRD